MSERNSDSRAGFSDFQSSEYDGNSYVKEPKPSRKRLDHNKNNGNNEWLLDQIRKLNHVKSDNVPRELLDDNYSADVPQEAAVPNRTQSKSGGVYKDPPKSSFQQKGQILRKFFHRNKKSPERPASASRKLPPDCLEVAQKLKVKEEVFAMDASMSRRQSSSLPKAISTPKKFKEGHSEPNLDKKLKDEQTGSSTRRIKPKDTYDRISRKRTSQPTKTPPQSPHPPLRGGGRPKQALSESVVRRERTKSRPAVSASQRNILLSEQIEKLENTNHDKDSEIEDLKHKIKFLEESISEMQIKANNTSAVSDKSPCLP